MQNNEKTTVYAGFFVRLCAYTVDMLIVGLGLLVLRIPFGIWAFANPENFLTRDLIFKYSIADVVLWILTVLYFVAMTYNTGSTLGKKLFRLEVISTEGEDLNFFEILYRESIGRYLSSVILCVGYLIIGVDEQKRGFHDMLADTRVIYKSGNRKSMYRKKQEAYYAAQAEEMARIAAKRRAEAEAEGVLRDVAMQGQGEYHPDRAYQQPIISSGQEDKMTQEMQQGEENQDLY